MSIQACISAVFGRPALWAGLVLAASLPAQAETFTVVSNLADNLYLNAATTGSFTLAGQLSPAGSFAAPYQINSASIAFSFADDSADELVLTKQITNAYTPTTVTSRVILQSFSDPAETASVAVGSQSANGASAAYTVASHLDHTTTDWSYYGNNCPGYTGPCNHTLFQGTSFYYVDVTGHGGPINLGYALNGANLSTLASTGVLSFNLGVGGDLVLTSARLTLDVTPSVSSVPEPQTWGLMVAGLAGVLRLSRRRVQANAA
jgi:hypothetical protein